MQDQRPNQSEYKQDETDPCNDRANRTQDKEKNS